MVLCKDCEFPCCDFCIYANRGKMIKNGKEITTGPIGCNLHKDEEHQSIAIGCGYCDDYHCFNAKDETTNQ